MQLQKNKSKAVLCVYASTQTFTATVFEHLDAFRKYSELSWHYADILLLEECDLSGYDALVIHYSVRLPFGGLSESNVKKLKAFKGLKTLFIQDEYDHTDRSKELIKEVGFGLVFSVVPQRSLDLVYPSEDFPGVRFVSNLTGYVPDELVQTVGTIIPPSQRKLLIAYRGRPLPVRYGRLGINKIEVGLRVKDYCSRNGLQCNIAWDEQSRIYGTDWYRFITSSRSMLGTESGSNVFDWDGNLNVRIDAYRTAHPQATDDDLYREVIAPEEKDGLMNQLSPRIFEMAAAKTAMVLLEGHYSNVLVPNVHYLSLKSDYSNLDEVFAFLSDKRAVDEMVERAFCDIIVSNEYGYGKFVQMVDCEILNKIAENPGRDRIDQGVIPVVQQGMTTSPIRAKSVLPSLLTSSSLLIIRLCGTILLFVWRRIPIRFRPFVKRLLGRV